MPSSEFSTLLERILAIEAMLSMPAARLDVEGPIGIASNLRDELVTHARMLTRMDDPFREHLEHGILSSLDPMEAMLCHHLGDDCQPVIADILKNRHPDWRIERCVSTYSSFR